MSARRARGCRCDTACSEARIFRETEPDWDGDLPIRREAIPIRVDGADATVVAVLGKDANLASVRTPEPARARLPADRGRPLGDGRRRHLPQPGRRREEGAGPRVGDGVLRLEPDGTIIYASPNALSAFSRLGIAGPVVGEPMHELTSTVADDPFDVARSRPTRSRRPSTAASRRASRSRAAARSVLFRALPLRPRGETLGALLLMQDVTELRRRDRQIMSKDATIREIHHRVKNNLQTVAALLRLQARRVAVPEARVALEESMRRVSSIALVHETLSVSVDEAVDFDEVVDRLLGMLADVDRRRRSDRPAPRRSFGVLPAEVATALVLVLTELVQNALEHGFPDADAGTVVIARASGLAAQLEIAVEDDGRGPAGRLRRRADRSARAADRAHAGVGRTGRHSRPTPAARTAPGRLRRCACRLGRRGPGRRLTGPAAGA